MPCCVDTGVGTEDATGATNREVESMNPRRVALHDDRTPGLIEDMKVVVAQSHANLPASITAVQHPIQAPTQVAPRFLLLWSLGAKSPAGQLTCWSCGRQGLGLL